MTNDISILGLGKLGASLAAVLASRGFKVTGVDLSEAAVSAVSEGRSPVEETGLAKLMGWLLLVRCVLG